MFEPLPGNYVRNLGVNLALVCGGNHVEIDEATPLVQTEALHADVFLESETYDGYLVPNTEYFVNTGELNAAQNSAARLSLVRLNPQKIPVSPPNSDRPNKLATTL